MKGKKDKAGAFRTVLLLLLFIAVLAGMVLVSVKYGDGSFSRALKNMIGGFSSGGTEEFYYEDSSGAAFAEFQGGLAIASTTGFSVLDKNGESILSELFFMTSPAVKCGEKYGVIYDIGGNNLRFFSKSQVILSLETEKRIVSASVSDKGYLAVCTEASGYDGEVTVYDSEGDAVYKWSSGSGYILDAVMDGRKLAVLTVGEGGSRVTVLELDSTEVSARFDWPGVLIDLEAQDGKLVLISAEAAVIINTAGEELSRYDFDGKHLKAYAVTEDMTALFLGEYSVGAGDVIALYSDGNADKLGTYGSDLMAAGAKGSFAAALYPHRAEVFSKDQNAPAVYDDIGAPEALMVKEDGSIITAGAFSAKVHTYAHNPAAEGAGADLN